MVKHIANINNYIVSIDSGGILNAPGLKSGVIEHPTGGTGNSGNYIVADGNGGWSWSSPVQTQSVGEINDLTDALRSDTNYFIGELGGQNVLINTSQVTAYGHNAGMAITSGSSNTLLGSYSGKNITSGVNNTLIGASSGTSLTTHQNNIFIGRESARQATSQYSLYIGVAAGFSSSSTHNIGIGQGAAFDNDGQYNVIIGPPSSSHVDTFTCHQATSSFSGNVVIGESAMQRTNITPARNGQSTWTGNHNVVIGKWATLQQTTSSNAIAIGYQAFADSNQIVIGNNSNTEFYLPGLQQNATSGDVLTYDGTKIVLSTPTSGSSVNEINDLSDGKTFNNSIFLGTNTGTNMTGGANNVAIGHEALKSLTSNSNNTAIGFQSLHTNTGARNTGIGHKSLFKNTTGSDNCSLGYNSVHENTTGYGNCGFGYYSLYENTTGYENVAMGHHALIYNANISQSVGIGAYTGGGQSDNHLQCVYIGYSAGPQTQATTNEIAIGSNALGHGSNTITLGNSSMTELHIPGLQSSASNGDVLTFDGTKINLSTLPANSGTVVEPFSVSSIGGLFTMTSLTGYYTMFHTYIDVEFSRISLYTMSDTSGASGTIVAGVFSNLSFAPNASLSQATTSFSGVTGVTEIIIDFNTVQLSPHNKYWLGISVQTTSGTLYLAKSALGSTDNYFALSEGSTFNGTTLSAPVSPSPSSFNFYYRLHRPSAPGGILSNSTTVPTAIEVAHAQGLDHNSTQYLTSTTVFTKIKFRTSGFYSSSNYTLSTSNSNITVLTDGLYSVHFTATTRLENGSTNRTTSSIALFINGVEFASSMVHTYNRIDPQSDNSASYTHVGYYTAGTQFDYRIKLDDGDGPIKVKDNGNHLTVMKLSN